VERVVGGCGEVQWGGCGGGGVGTAELRGGKVSLAVRRRGLGG
jgi:hypothetical protein